VTQAVALGFSLLLAAGMWLLRGHWPFPGASFLLYGLLYFAGQFFLEFTRGDEAIYLGSLRLAQIIDLAHGLLLLWWRGEEEPAGEEALPSDEQEALPADVEEAPPPDEDEAPPPDEEEALPPDEEVALAAGDDEPEDGEEG